MNGYTIDRRSAHDVRISFDGNTPEAYSFFLRCKKLPRKLWTGRTVLTDEWSLAFILGEDAATQEVSYSDYLFDYQSWLVNRSLRAQKYGVWADTGLGKTAIELEYARLLQPNGPVLIVCPLSVAEQTQEECEKFYGHNFVKRLSRQPDSSPGEGVWLINYERLKEGVDFSWANAVVLDECAILRNKFGVTYKILRSAVDKVNYRLALSATPAPNEYAEYANIALWLGVVRSLSEFFSGFFIHDETLGRWRPKRHAEKELWRWIASWGLYMHDPERWGFAPLKLQMPTVSYHKHQVLADGQSVKEAKVASQSLLSQDAGRMMKRSDLARITKRLGERYELIRRIRNEAPDKQSLVWVHHNYEQDQVKAVIPDAVVIDGSTPHDKREEIRRAFIRGDVRTLISKPSVMSQGVNLQVAEQVIFSSLSDSFDDWYQAKNRVVRRGGRDHVDVHIVYSDLEAVVLDNVMNKQHNFLADVQHCEDVFIEQYSDAIRRTREVA